MECEGSGIYEAINKMKDIQFYKGIVENLNDILVQFEFF